MKYWERTALRPALGQFFHQPFRPLPGPVVITSVVKAQGGPLLAGLDMAHYEACCHQFASNFHAFNQVEELPHLLHVITVWFLRLALLALWDVVDVAADCRVALLHVEPLGVPSLQ